MDEDDDIALMRVEDNVTGPVVSGADFTKIRTKPATVLKAYYFFCDAEGDAEDGSHFTWYRCTDPDDTGVEIAGATGRQYTVTTADMNNYLRVEMVPCADSGIQDGETIAGPVSSQLLYTMGG
jgi:hypothetical protein